MYSDDIEPEKPLFVMYNADTNQLGISAANWPIVMVVTFVPFVRTPATYTPFKASYEARIGYAKHEGMVAKDESWDIVAEF